MSDNDRPRPQYGEYATPQEQAKAIAKSQPPPSRAEPPAPLAENRFSTPPPAVGSPEPVRARRSSAERLATIFLLALGLVYLVSGAPSYLALPATLDAVYEQWGIGSYAATGFASAIGIAVVVSQALVWLAIAFIAVRRLRKGRSSWWVPIAGAVVTFVVTVILMAVVIMSDPAFTTYLTSA